MAVALAAVAWAATGAGVAGASPRKTPRCETFSVNGQRWGVYVERGSVGCASAGKVLKGVLAGKGRNVDKGPADEYIVYDGWACPYYQMGVVSCQHGSRPVERPSSAIFALSCATATGQPACPARAEA